jgi:hypothetical protein
MSVLELRYASDVGIEPTQIKGMEQQGLCFFTKDNSDTLGGQCSCCHTIIWVNGRKHPILGEELPTSLEGGGPAYRAYYQGKLKRFLLSLPPCPSCGKTEYDLFINNGVIPRLSDGKDISNRDRLTPIPVEPNSVKVWWFEP